MKYFLPVSFTLLTISCSSAPTALTPTGGSKSDAVVEMAYSTGMFRSLAIDWKATNQAAIDRCASWGFSGAERFGGSTKTCVQHYDEDCLRYEHVYKYQCTD